MKAATAVAAMLAAAWLAGTCRAQEPSAKVMTWDDCVSLALRRNPDLAASRAAENASEASRKSSFNGLLPSLNLSNSYNTSNSAVSATNKYSAQASASLSLYNASSWASIKSASASLSQAQAGLRQVSANLRFNLRQAFAQMIFAQRSLEVSRNIRDMRRRGAQLVTLRYNSGRESKGNMLRANAQLAQAEADLAQARRAVRTAQRTLDRQLGLDDFDVVAAAGALEAAPPPESPGNEPEELARRPDVALQQAVIRSAAASVDSAKSPLLPSLTGSYTRSRSDTTEFPDRNYGWTGGFTLSLPLFGGGPTAVYYNVAAAKKSLAKAQEDLRSVRDAAIVDLESTWASYSSAFDQISVQRALLEAARQRNDEADVRYASGLLTYDSWEIIASDRISSERQAISSQFNAAVAQAAWEKSTGKELGE